MAVSPSNAPPPNVTLAPLFVGIVTTFFLISLLFFLARIYTRIWIIKLFWWDDAVLLIGMVGLGAAIPWSSAKLKI